MEWAVNIIEQSETMGCKHNRGVWGVARTCPWFHTANPPPFLELRCYVVRVDQSGISSRFLKDVPFGMCAERPASNDSRVWWAHCDEDNRKCLAVDLGHGKPPVLITVPQYFHYPIIRDAQEARKDIKRYGYSYQQEVLHILRAVNVRGRRRPGLHATYLCLKGQEPRFDSTTFETSPVIQILDAR